MCICKLRGIDNVERTGCGCDLRVISKEHMVALVEFHGIARIWNFMVFRGFQGK